MRKKKKKEKKRDRERERQSERNTYSERAIEKRASGRKTGLVAPVSTTSSVTPRENTSHAGLMCPDSMNSLAMYPGVPMMVQVEMCGFEKP